VKVTPKRLFADICCLDYLILLNFGIFGASFTLAMGFGKGRTWLESCNLHFAEKNSSALATIVNKVRIQCNMIWIVRVIRKKKKIVSWLKPWSNGP